MMEPMITMTRHMDPTSERRFFVSPMMRQKRLSRCMSVPERIFTPQAFSPKIDSCANARGSRRAYQMMRARYFIPIVYASVYDLASIHVNSDWFWLYK